MEGSWKIPGIFQTQGLNSHLQHWQAGSWPLVSPGKPEISSFGVGGTLLMLSYRSKRTSMVKHLITQCYPFTLYFWHWYGGTENWIKIPWTRIVVPKLEWTPESPGSLLKTQIPRPHTQRPYFEQLSWDKCRPLGLPVLKTHTYTSIRHLFSFLPNPFFNAYQLPQSLVLASSLSSPPSSQPTQLSGTSRKGLWICFSRTELPTP